MKRWVNHIASIFLLLMAVFSPATAQETVFALVHSDNKLAEQYFRNGDYSAAISHYERADRKAASLETQLKIASCYFALKNYRQAVTLYERLYIKEALGADAMNKYADALCTMGDYKKALDVYQELAKLARDKEIYYKRIWRLNNLQYLYEDSMHFAVRRLQINTSAGELRATPFGKESIVFVSNRKQPQVVETVSSRGSFYQLYTSHVGTDSTSDIAGKKQYSAPVLFGKNISESNGQHIGPIAFFNNNTECVFARNATTKNGSRLQLFFAKRFADEWKETAEFPFNSNEYSVTDPAITEDGNILFFSSDMKNGFGGRDLYRVDLVDGQWSKPKNLGEVINTPFDEQYPFIHNGSTLYFSSNGHAGMGGLDLFRSSVGATGYEEPVNVGYPLNSSYDDFGISIDSLESGGYFSSNRANGGYDDDLYQFEMDLQSYPITVEGIAHLKEHDWSDSTAVEPIPNATLKLVDNIRNIVVSQTVTNSRGEFSLVIPYFSQYMITLAEGENIEHKVILEIPKHRKEISAHHIVFIKDLFAHESH